MISQLVPFKCRIITEEIRVHIMLSNPLWKLDQQRSFYKRSPGMGLNHKNWRTCLTKGLLTLGSLIGFLLSPAEWREFLQRPFSGLHFWSFHSLKSTSKSRWWCLELVIIFSFPWSASVIQVMPFTGILPSITIFNFFLSRSHQYKQCEGKIVTIIVLRFRCTESSPEWSSSVVGQVKVKDRNKL